MPLYSGPIPAKPVAVHMIDSIPSATRAPVKEEREESGISKWKLGRKTNTIYGDWIHDFGDLTTTTPQKFSSDAEKS